MNSYKIIFALLWLYSALIGRAEAYIDPGSGSYFFQIMIAALLGGLYAIKIYWKNICSKFDKSAKKSDEPSE
jgi:hypothetical protein